MRYWKKPRRPETDEEFRLRTGHGSLCNRVVKFRGRVIISRLKICNCEVTHQCHWPGCKIAVPPTLFACTRHWFTLPKWIRDLIWETYVPGQENRKDPSPAYLEAADKAQKWALEYEKGKVRTARGETIDMETGEINGQA